MTLTPLRPFSHAPRCPQAQGTPAFMAPELFISTEVDGDDSYVCSEGQ